MPNDRSRVGFVLVRFIGPALRIDGKNLFASVGKRTMTGVVQKSR